MTDTDWMHAINAALDEGIASLRRDLAKQAPDHNPAITLHDLGKTIIGTAQVDWRQVALTAAAALYRLASQPQVHYTYRYPRSGYTHFLWFPTFVDAVRAAEMPPYDREPFEILVAEHHHSGTGGERTGA